MNQEMLNLEVQDIKCEGFDLEAFDIHPLVLIEEQGTESEEQELITGNVDYEYQQITLLFKKESHFKFVSEKIKGNSPSEKGENLAILLGFRHT